MLIGQSSSSGASIQSRISPNSERGRFSAAPVSSGGANGFLYASSSASALSIVAELEGEPAVECEVRPEAELEVEANPELDTASSGAGGWVCSIGARVTDVWGARALS